MKELGEDRARFFLTDVTSTSSISDAVEKVAQWTRHTGKELGGVIAAAGIGSAAKVWMSESCSGTHELAVIT